MTLLSDRFSDGFQCLLLTWLITAAPLVYAEEPMDTRPALGLGGEACSTFISTYEHNPDSLGDEHLETGDEGPHHKTSHTSADYIHWLQGYLSAYSSHDNNGKDITHGASTGGMLYFLYRRCSEEPDAPFDAMMPALLERLKR